MILFPWQKKKRKRPVMAPLDDKPVPLGYRSASLQEQGKREYQEDAFILINHQDVKSQQRMGFLAVVADGMGGMRDGRLASDTATTCISNSFSRQAPLEDPADWLEEQFLGINEQVYTLLEGEGGSTMIACLLHENKLWFASVGDSYLYLYRDGELSLLNRMQTVLHRELMATIREGSADPSVARQHHQPEALTGFLGMGGLSDVDLLRSPLPMKDADVLIVCSDGVGGVLEEADILYCIQQGDADEIRDALRQRVISKDKPYQDNFTAVVIQCVI